MGIPLAPISLERGNPWLAAKKMAKARVPRAKCTTTRAARQNMSGPNARSPANQKKPAAKRAEAYYAHNERHPASDAASLSEHRTALASNKSSKGYSSCLDHSDNEDNFAIAISASPRKRAKCNVLPPKRKLTITMSESDKDANNNGNNG
jgi:hypothetical protein